MERFDQLAAHLRDESLEGLDENNVHRFHHALCLHLPVATRPELPDALLLEYDQAIVSVTQRLNERRVTRGEPPIVWKYFQYLALLFTEIYLDRYFRNPKALRQAVNERIAAVNEQLSEADRIAPLDESGDARLQLNKIAFWMATGSGKTLLMHAHILQYRRFLETRGRAGSLNRIILLTPNEGLSRQHLRELEKSGIAAEIFNKDGRGLFAGHAVEILEVTKLKDESGAKTVAVDAFESNNLVLVDEGHRGASAGGDGAWMKARNALCENGFSFEYSATFGQAVQGRPQLAALYARSVLFDYSYRWFYGDGFGKDYQILNLEDDRDENWMADYLTACLLTFFQQQRLYGEQEAAFRRFNLERPLWVFVGGSVNAVRSERSQQVSDVVAILKFLDDYVKNEAGAAVQRIARILNQGLQTASGRNLLAGRFAYLNACKLQPKDVFNETLKTLFNAPGGGALHIENLKGVSGEIALRVGDNPPFGVINVGDDAKLLKLCEEKGFTVAEREFAESLFHELEQPKSSINLLIGSKKFTEGWSSWRVSVMGLMNVGRSEGAQIIQLFGRGVRLKGYGLSLKRSARAALPPSVERPKHIETLETLHIFGVRADYMAQFRAFLEDEGLPPDRERIEVVLPIIKNLGERPLKIIRLKKTINGKQTAFGDAFRKLGPIPTVQPPNSSDATAYLRERPVTVNWYPKIEAMKSAGVKGGETDGKLHAARLTERHVAFLDLDRLYFDLERYKAERGWHNLNLTREGVAALLRDTTWYQLLIPPEALAFDAFDKVGLWQEAAQALLRKYVERYYVFRKREWELPHLEYQDLAADDSNFPRAGDAGEGYRVVIEAAQEEIARKIEELKKAITEGALKYWEFGGLKAIFFERHLYQPLLFVANGMVEISPTPLNEGERRFVEDLRAFHEANTDFFNGKELYLLRNLSRGRGVGFFEAGNFHPDFIVWLVEGDRQRIAFVDPKGIRQIGLKDPKIGFYGTVKDIEKRLGDPNVTLEAFIVSNTPAHVMEKQWGVTKEQMAGWHIVFQDEGRNEYIRTILESSAGAGA